MSNNVTISAILPVYNEAEAIRETLQRVRKALQATQESFEIIVVDDGSKDGSAALIRKEKGVMLLQHPANRGYGAALKTGIEAAQGSWILITDSDGTYPNEQIPVLWKETKKIGVDMVVGSRTGASVHIPTLRRPAKWILKKIVHALTGVSVSDLNSGLRIFKKSLAREFWNLFPEGFSFTTTITVASLMNNKHVIYVPINYHPRKGTSTIHPIRDFLGFMLLIFRIVTYFNPLKFFLPISAVFISIALLKGLRDFWLENSIGSLAVILLIAGIQVFFFGLLADLVNHRLK